jgi:hypothetical protein
MSGAVTRKCRSQLLDPQVLYRIGQGGFDDLQADG